MLDSQVRTFPESTSTVPLLEAVHVEEIQDAAGSCIAIHWSFPLDSTCDDARLFAFTRSRLCRDLTVIKGIGTETREKLKRRQVCSIADLQYASNRAWRRQAAQVMQWVRGKYAELLRATRRVKDIDLLFCFSPENVIYLDIETTGLVDARVFAIALGMVSPGKKEFVIHQFFARDCQEEYTILGKVHDILATSKCIVSFNGKAFDVPVLMSRFWYYFQVDDAGWARFHVDLMHDARRLLGLKKRERLSFYEAIATGNRRPFDVHSATIPGLYEEFIESSRAPDFAGLLQQALDCSKPVAVNDAAGDDVILIDMFRVIYHNMLDVKALHDILVFLLHRIKDQAKQPRSKA
nr:ribonuclease H-like domain-containing protein [Candidatus Sigynarchaeota archaeon]